MDFRPFLFAALLALMASGCTPDAPSLPAPDTDSLRVEFERLTAARDSLFLSGQSPLLPEARTSFDGLSYFPFDPSLAFRIRIRPFLSSDTLLMTTSTGEARPYIRYGTLRFDTEGRGHTLTVFKAVGPEATGSLFLPFQDATSGRTTYGGGRYLDLHETADGIYTLDFNQAYHPYCVFNVAYSCPVPPPENGLSFAVTAGERLPDGS